MEVQSTFIPSIVPKSRTPRNEIAWITPPSMYYARVGLRAMLNNAMPDYRTFARVQSIPTALAQSIYVEQIGRWKLRQHWRRTGRSTSGGTNIYFLHSRTNIGIPIYTHRPNRFVTTKKKARVPLIPSPIQVCESNFVFLKIKHDILILRKCFTEIPHNHISISKSADIEHTCITDEVNVIRGNNLPSPFGFSKSIFDMGKGGHLGAVNLVE